MVSTSIPCAATVSEREYQRQQEKSQKTYLDEITSNAVKGFDLSLKEYFIDAINDTDFTKFMEIMENESRPEVMAKAAARLYQDIYDKTRAHIESELV